MIELTYEMHLKAPVHIGTGYGFAGFLDSVAIRDGHGHVYIPGSTIKGKTRASARRLLRGLSDDSQLCPAGMPCTLLRDTPCPVCRLFGSPQFPGKLHFDNVQLPLSYRKLLDEMTNQDPLLARRAVTQRRTNVMLSRRRRAAQPDHLFTNELISPSLPFSGRIKGDVSGLEGADISLLRNDLALLWGALKLVTHVGKARGRGLGHCVIAVTSLQVANTSFTKADFETALRHLGGGADS